MAKRYPHYISTKSSEQKIFLISLGCSRNKVDSEVMLGKLLPKYAIAADAQEADVIIINTCGFIQAAKEESVATILKQVELKAERPHLKVIVARLSNPTL